MLSGRPPFLALRVHEDSAASIMNRIKVGEFRMDDDLWRGVSSQGRSIVKGLLTVDPKRRLRLEDLLQSPWICQQQHFSQFNNNPAAQYAPAVRAVLGRVDRQLKQTFNAFHSVARAGGLSQLKAPNISVTKIVVPTSSHPSVPSATRRHLKSSTVSSTTTCSSSSSSSSSATISISLLAQHSAATVASHPAAFIFQPNFTSSHLATPFIAEAIQGVSTHILPSQVSSSVTHHYPIVSSIGGVAYGPMTRLRKRKMAERTSPGQDLSHCFEASLACLQNQMAQSLLPSLHSGRTFLTADAEACPEQSKKLKTESNLLPSTTGSYYSVSLTRVPNSGVQLINSPATIPRPFQSTRTPTITID